MSVLAPQAAPGGVSRTLAAFLKASRRSWWQARYRGGKVVAEWETAKIALPVPLPGGLGRSSRWETLDKRGLVGLRLLCPEGRVGELVAGSDFKLFQLKSGVLRLGQGTEIRGHLVGLVTSSEGAAPVSPGSRVTAWSGRSTTTCSTSSTTTSVRSGSKRSG